MKHIILFLLFTLPYSLQASSMGDVYIDVSNIKGKLTNLAYRADISEPNIISLPLPDGSLVRLKFSDNSIVENGVILSDSFKTWQVTGEDDPLITGVIDISANGFHAMLLMPNGKTVFIDPKNVKQDQYETYFKRSSAKDADFNCLTKSRVKNHSSSIVPSFQKRTARNIVTYRLALAATGQFSRYHTDEGRVAKDEIMTMVARLNVIYLRDLGVKLKLVKANSKIIFTMANDPYDSHDIESLAIQNRSVLNNIIGNSNYDIGHVVTRFETNKSGVALLGSVCKTENTAHKSMAATGHPTPMGDIFTIDFLAHEIGHQLGATHTFNSEISICGYTREPATAYEPGSGSSIMAYAGICGSDSIATNSHAVFHIASIEQINTFVRHKGGLSCGSEVASNNVAPKITAITKGVIVNVGDSFTLTASATDGDNDDLTYNWDQFDSGLASTVHEDKGDNALYAITLPNADPSRTFTAKATLDRDLTFKLVVRDGKGGVSSAITVVKVSTSDATAVGSLATVSNDQEYPVSPRKRGPVKITKSKGGGGGSYSIRLLILLGLMGIFVNLLRKNNE